MKVTKTRLKEIILEELAAVQEEVATVAEGELEEGMFGLTTTSSSDQKLRDQRDMWLSRVHSLYIALRDSVGRQRANMVLDSIGMSPADLRPEERSRLEEGELEEGTLEEYDDYEGPKSAATTSPRYGQPKPCPKGKIPDVDPGGRRRCVDKNYRRPGFFEE